MNLEDEGRTVQALLRRITTAEDTLEREKGSLDKAQAQLQNCQQAQEIVQLLAEAVQQRAHQQISEVVTSCLSAVFDDPYEFKIVFERKRGRTEAQLRFVRRGLEVDPMSAAGGGAVDVAAFALRVACLVLHRPRLSKILVLDEPFKFVSAEYRPRVRQMLEELAKKMEMQIVMVTHADDLVTGKVIHVPANV